MGFYRFLETIGGVQRECLILRRGAAPTWQSVFPHPPQRPNGQDPHTQKIGGRYYDKPQSTKRALLGSVMAMVLCLAMLVGATFAWFTDTASTGVNKIQAGNLDIEIQDETGKAIDTLAWATKDGTAFAEDGKTPLWEPGCTYTLTPFQIVNKGNLALKYKIVVTGLEGDTGLLKVIKFTYKTGEETFDMNTEGHLTANGGASKVITVSAHMDEAAGNEYMNKTLEGVKFTVYATQDTVESDSFNNTYDANATYPVVNVTELKEALTNGGVVNVATDIRTNNSEDTAAARIVISQPTTLNLEKKIITPDNMGNNNTNFCALHRRCGYHHQCGRERRH